MVLSVKVEEGSGVVNIRVPVGGDGVPYKVVCGQ